MFRIHSRFFPLNKGPHPKKLALNLYFFFLYIIFIIFIPKPGYFFFFATGLFFYKLRAAYVDAS